MLEILLTRTERMQVFRWVHFGSKIVALEYLLILLLTDIGCAVSYSKKHGFWEFMKLSDNSLPVSEAGLTLFKWIIIAITILAGYIYYKTWVEFDKIADWNEDIWL